MFPPIELSKDGGGSLECRERWDTMGRSLEAPLARNSEGFNFVDCGRLGLGFFESSWIQERPSGRLSVNLSQ